MYATSDDVSRIEVSQAGWDSTFKSIVFRCLSQVYEPSKKMSHMISCVQFECRI